ncbi:hypothetical protein OSB04_010038 [Centaurea solstitialis]|uniref:Transferase, Chloramphenicol acetyltransferase-like domain protein n=1 Tax=Centaurea solstitialis TaxID=347529 RepID=A0AA38WMQ6_9ASTR|nr:hypothetical protein OSB04_010038 [Centaurea solstitialis]
MDAPNEDGIEALVCLGKQDMTIIQTDTKRQLHTIISREIIKPSSPTPSHLRTHNLSLLDQIATNTFMPMVAFYPNTDISGSSDAKMCELKNSLSQTLTKYYPFAGRHAKVAPSYVDCNDDGAAFVEASVGSTLLDFFRHSQHEDLTQFFSYDRIWCNENRSGDHDLQSDDGVIPLVVQASHFECGGVAVAISLSHKLADGSSLLHFFNDWAKMTRFCSSKQKQPFPIDPRFIPFQNINMNFDGISLAVSNDCITRSFTFPNSKINDLKTKVKSMTIDSRQPITNPTRVEVLTWLLFNRMVAATTKNNSGSFKPPSFGNLINIRNKMIEPLPKNTIGNFISFTEIRVMNEDEMKPESFIGELKKQKMQFQGLTNMEDAFSHLSGTSVEEMQRIFDESYGCTSLCRYPAYEINFGWGNPVKITIVGNVKKNCVLLMDAPNEDGIEALVCLGKQDMAIIQTDPELLEFC